MSLVFITNHNEVITDMFKGPTRQPRGPLYKGKFHAERAKEQRTHATMGVPQEEPPDPQKFLKKGHGQPCYTKSIELEKPGRICEKLQAKHKADTPLVRDLYEAHKIHEKLVESTKNFVKGNIQKAKEMKAKDPDRKIVVDRVGTKINPVAQGLEPVYIKKPVYGDYPKYLKKFKEEAELKRHLTKDVMGTGTSHQALRCKYITGMQKREMLAGLKHNWEESLKLLQQLPIFTDTLPKKVKKTKLENCLKQLERDIVLLERHSCIFVYDDRKKAKTP
ncbi:unnamed protein product [Ceutorhynchus assimilis]|uniref:Enkurin domain-containing protein n=1 Tax=Ceutorhynchus assimilis TaxID=467358 RepID=A0A9N9MTY9_9CUCU|nr:unnamed protein product [Ceutorhynchus assimilis]